MFASHFFRNAYNDIVIVSFSSVACICQFLPTFACSLRPRRWFKLHFDNQKIIPHKPNDTKKIDILPKYYGQVYPELA